MLELPKLKSEDEMASNAYLNLATVLHAVGRYPEAIEAEKKCLEINPNNHMGYAYQGATLTQLGFLGHAIKSYERAVTIRPDFEWVLGIWLHAKMQTCDWENLENNIGGVIERIPKGVAPPFTVLGFTDDPAMQRRAAEVWGKAQHPPLQHVLGPVPKYKRHEKIRVGYFSCDFYNHSTLHLMLGLFENHDRSKFEINAISFGADAQDMARGRLVKSVDRFIDVQKNQEHEIAKMARELELDIAIDLKGSTKDERGNIFAIGAAPIQVLHMGYPGTMGMPYYDYFVADPMLIPPEHRSHYAENIIYMPNSYQANDNQREVDGKVWTREECGLPAEGFVFCCFNASYKITPKMFDVWMNLLKRVPGSTLWLLKHNKIALENLEKEIIARGVDPARVVYAEPIGPHLHLARHKLADLSLDTYPVNAHTTCSDSLWVGVPMITMLGKSFVARVAASLLANIGLKDMIVADLAEYESLAYRLATDKDYMARVRERLALNIKTEPLFDTVRYTRDFERGLIEIYERHQEGLQATDIFL